MHDWLTRESSFRRLSMWISWRSTYSISSWVHCCNSCLARFPWPRSFTFSSSSVGSDPFNPLLCSSSRFNRKSFSQLETKLHRNQQKRPTSNIPSKLQQDPAVWSPAALVLPYLQKLSNQVHEVRLPLCEDLTSSKTFRNFSIFSFGKTVLVDQTFSTFSTPLRIEWWVKFLNADSTRSCQTSQKAWNGINWHTTHRLVLDAAFCNFERHHWPSRARSIYAHDPTCWSAPPNNPKFHPNFYSVSKSIATWPWSNPGSLWPRPTSAEAAPMQLPPLAFQFFI